MVMMEKKPWFGICSKIVSAALRPNNNWTRLKRFRNLVAAPTPLTPNRRRCPQIPVPNSTSQWPDIQNATVDPTSKPGSESPSDTDLVPRLSPSPPTFGVIGPHSGPTFSTPIQDAEPTSSRPKSQAPRVALVTIAVSTDPGKHTNAAATATATTTAPLCVSSHI
ncbi:S-adenosyl-L-methionine-dependentmethyltransferases superfamily protein [Striga asiatica]|uniref:S-adenosyl-L-methionine-dependentmethyltransferases superfamily protein n=1 Tax=Striga asiatica TaxID=4170 RepID=A0A5A7P3N7_STRAF|nr:S-adenosyl-L-methionine-dependentmethyltransferases superfamily protein [Striga asiatica]